ncbi:MAG: head-tail connector protein [Holosporaceae bacterium]|jgi:uncharacterized phiE125 gp8 family phage protein|nr:head-tail connector protein [Holosporaceae bacterium]
MQLNLIEKSSEEIITLEEAKNYLRVSHDFDDHLINGLIKSARGIIESFIQKSILKQVWEYRLKDCSKGHGPLKWDGFQRIIGGIATILLPNPPILKIVSVGTRDHEIDPSSYSFEQRGSQYFLCINDTSFFRNREANSITIRYEAGIADSVDSIPYQLKLASLMLIANAFQERFSCGQGDVIPPGIRQLLSPFLTIRIL